MSPEQHLTPPIADRATRAAEPSAPVRRSPTTLQKLGWIALSGAVLVLVLEWALRAANVERLSHTNPALYEVDDELGYRMRADVRVYSHGTWFETNAHGLRGPDWDEVHAAGKRCALFIGHSIAGGFGVKDEEAYPARFTEENRPGLVAINLGHCGYRYWQEFALARRYLDEIQPAVTVVMFTGNDFEDLYDPFNPSIDGPDSPNRAEETGALPVPGKRWLRRNSVVYAFLRKRWGKLMVILGAREMPASFDPALLAGETEESRRHFEEYERQLAELKRASDVPMVLCAFPPGQTEKSYGILRGIAERVGARWVDFSDLWEDELDYAARGALPWGAHPSAETHEVLAERIVAAVDELLPE